MASVRLGLTALVLISSALAKTVTYNWTINWVNVNPDGRTNRPAIGVNNQWPCPAITASVGDNVVVNVVNQLGNETTSVHFHGMYQTGTNAMDGPSGVTQCEIPPGASYTYSFTVDQPGTYWYHSHTKAQYPDGLRGPMIIEDPKGPYAGQYDAELTVTLSDWYLDQMPSLISNYLSPDTNKDAAEPVPYSMLMNDAQGIKLNVKPGKTYLVRVISISGFSQSYLHFDQHEMTIIEADGIYTQPRTVETLYVATGQRYAVLLKTKPTASQNYAVLGSMDTGKFDDVPSYVNPNVTGYLVYDAKKPLPPPPTLAAFNVIDDFTLVPHDGQQLLSGTPDQSIVLNMDFFKRYGQNRAGFNNVSYVEPKVPTLYTVMSVGKDAENPVVYGVNSNAFVVKQGQLVEIVINNWDSGSHPIHMHGRATQLVARSPGVSDGDADDQALDPTEGHNATATLGYTGNTSNMPPIPMRRDTWMVSPMGYAVIRYVATNPGVWIIHCHMEWHVSAGLLATIIEAPLQIQAQQSIPKAAIQMCQAQGVPTAGNAAGNTKNHTDLTGANTQAPPHDQCS